MYRFRSSIVPVLAAALIAGGPCLAVANPVEDYASTEVRQADSNTLTLIEDNGQAYEEILIDQLTRASGTYSTTYDMKGGVYTQQSWNATSAPTFKVKVTPTHYEGEAGVGMGIYLQKKNIFGGWDNVASSSVRLDRGGTVTLKGSSKGTYRLYFRNWSGFRAMGRIVITYSY